jgi:hypothetical protein
MDPISHNVNDQRAWHNVHHLEKKGKRWLLPSLQPTQMEKTVVIDFLLQEINPNLEREEII